MPLQVDPRIGSGEFKDVLLDMKLPVEVTPLAFGDMAFLGTGPEGCPVPVGIERKAIKDFINSCRSERLQGHQLPGLHQCYQSVWIVIEGAWKVDWKTGNILVPAGYKKWGPLELGSVVHGSEWFGRIMTLRLKAGVHIEHTDGKLGTARFIKRLYEWWEKGWDSHGSHLGFPELSDAAMLTSYDRSNPRHLVRLFAKEMKLIGWEKSGNVMAAFKTPLDMAQATVQQWSAIPGIGKILAHRLVKSLQGTPHE